MKKIITYAIISMFLFIGCKSQKEFISSGAIGTGEENFLTARQLFMDDGILVVVRDDAGQESYSKVIFTGYKNNIFIAIDPNHRISAGIYIIIAAQKDFFVNQKIFVGASFRG